MTGTPAPITMTVDSTKGWHVHGTFHLDDCKYSVVAIRDDTHMDVILVDRIRHD